jgi:cell division protein ZapA (FtsZ GTPase activity inhibitor)
MQKQLKVSINGKQYSLATDELDTDVYQAAQLVDTLLKSKLEKAPHLNEDKLALVVALHLATDLAKNQRLLRANEDKLEQLLVMLSKEA